MKKLEDVMNEAQFEESKKLASEMLRVYGDRQFTPAQVILACMMLIGGFVYKDINSRAMLHSASDFVATLFRTSILRFRADHDLFMEEDVQFNSNKSETVD